MTDRDQTNLDRLLRLAARPRTPITQLERALLQRIDVRRNELLCVRDYEAFDQLVRKHISGGDE